MPAEQQEGTRSVLSAWLKEAGAQVKQHEPIAEVETDKVVIEIAAPADGVLGPLLVEAGDELAPGARMAVLSTATSSEQVGSDEAVAESHAASDTPPTASLAASPTQPPASGLPNTPLPERATRADPTGGRARLSPAVRRLLKEHQIDAQSVPGTGKRGRVTVPDVRRYLASATDNAAARAIASPTENIATETPIPPGARAKPSDGTLGNTIASHPESLSPMRRAIAQHMSESLLQTAPHVTSVFECDMSQVLRHRRARKEAWAAQGVKLTVTAYILCAVAEALRAIPQVNSRYRGDHIELYDEINVGIGTALGDEGLVVPVIRGLDTMNLRGVAEALQRITEKARSRQLTPRDMQGGTFTISNHGVSGSLLAAPIIINQPQSAILGVGKLSKQVIVRQVDGQDVIAIAPMCYLTLTLDHRVLDAYQANGFLKAVVDRLQDWE